MFSLIWFLLFSLQLLGAIVQLRGIQLQSCICSSICLNSQHVTTEDRGQNTQFPKLKEIKVSTGAPLCLCRPCFLHLKTSICFARRAQSEAEQSNSEDRMELQG